MSSVLLVTLCYGLLGHEAAHGAEFRFVVADQPDQSAAWLPSEVVIHAGTDLDGGVVFVLENPTARTHVFLVEGLYEQSAGENGNVIRKPLRVTLAPEETVRTLLDMEQFARRPEQQEAQEFRFYCPLHRSDVDPGGTIHLIHRGGTIRMVQ
jgi:hypothetical protein